MSKPKVLRPKPEFTLDQDASSPLYQQLFERLRAQILTGRLEARTRLPSTRVLAGTLGVSRTTTARAYEQLLLEGFVESKVGDGTRVACLQSEQLFQLAGRQDEPSAEDRDASPATAVSQRTQALLDLPRPEDAVANQASLGTCPFPVGQPDVASFPYTTWARLVARAARRSLESVAQYEHMQGYGPLRQAIAAHIGVARGVHCSAEQVIVTSGSQGALDLIARVLLDAGDPAWIEDPGYTGARGALLAAGARPVPVPVDREGIDVAHGRAVCPSARLAIVTPSHQFPTGVTMSLSRRLALLDWARAADAWIVEDDYDSEYRFSGRPLEALHGLDSAGRVLYVGTFSKVLFPSLRVGYVVAPPMLLGGLIAARRFIDIHPPLLEQLALVDFMNEGHFVRHVRKMRDIYAERRNALVDALTRELGGELDVVVPEAGIHLATWMSEDTSIPPTTLRTVAQRLNILRASQLSVRPLHRDGLLLGFASAVPEQLRANVHMLARALAGHAHDVVTPLSCQSPGTPKSRSRDQHRGSEDLRGVGS
ncbi:MAG: PLP-dependent aminotransferase family protein [Chloroflexi bacterium]|nr:PLP-dependent aminotransferase family protein [Chloroflexota bacterium]